MNNSNIATITVSTVTMATTSTSATTSQSCAPCTLNSTCIQTSPPIVCSDTSTSVEASLVGVILVGVVCGVLVMIIVWVIVTVISKKKSIIDRKRNIEKFSMTIIIEFSSVIFLDHMMLSTN